MPDKATISPDYTIWLGEVKTRIQAARILAARSVNRELILLYWDIGQGIVKKQEELGWGKSVVETLSRDLKIEFPGLHGFSANNLWLMRQFFSEYSAKEFLEQVVQDFGQKQRPFQEQTVSKPMATTAGGRLADHSQILEQLVQELLSQVPWGHHVEIMKKVKSGFERLYYLRSTVQFGWTRNVLLNQIKAGAYERSLAEGKTHNFHAALPEYLAEQAEETLKSAYNLEFL